MAIKDNSIVRGRDKTKYKMKFDFVEILKCSTPGKLNEVIKEKAVSNPCLQIDEADEKQENESDIDEEPEFLLDGEMETDPEFFHDEELDDYEWDTNWHKTTWDIKEPIELLEHNLDNNNPLIAKIAEAQSTNESFREILKEMIGLNHLEENKIEPFLSIRVFDERPHIDIHEPSEFQKLSLDENLKDHLKNEYEEASQFISYIKSQKGYLTKLAEILVDKQKDFFREKDFLSAVLKLKSYSIHEASKMLKIDKSTGSRLISGKIVCTRFGYLPLQFFFSANSNKRKNEGEIVPVAITEVLKNMMQEYQKLPTDPEIKKILSEKGIEITCEMIKYYRKKIGFTKKRGRTK